MGLCELRAKNLGVVRAAAGIGLGAVSMFNPELFVHLFFSFGLITLNVF